MLTFFINSEYLMVFANLYTLVHLIILQNLIKLQYIKYRSNILQLVSDINSQLKNELVLNYRK